MFDINASTMPAAIADEALAAWARGDLDRLMALFDRDVRFTIHADEHQLELGGTVIGKDAARARLQQFLDLFAFETFDVERRDADDDVVRTKISFSCRHRGSLHQLSGTYRHEIRVSDGKIVSVDKYHDAAMLRAFLAMATAA